MGNTEGPLKCLEEVCHKMPAPQWHIQGETRNWLECGLGVLHVSPPWVEGPVHDQMRLLALNGYGSRVIAILIGSVGNIGYTGV